MDVVRDSAAVLTLSLLVAATGILTSSFIVFDILQAVYRGRATSTRDKIVLALSFSNMASPLILMASVVCDVFWLGSDILDLAVTYMLVLYCMSSSSWLTTCLCFFYYMKVMPFRSGYLSILKSNLEVLMPWTILLVEVASLGGSFVYIMLEIILEVKNTSSNITDEKSSADGFYNAMYITNFVSYPLIIVASGSIMASVSAHIHRMRMNSATSGSINLDAHQRVVGTMGRLVAFYVAFFLLLLIEYRVRLPGVWRHCTYEIILLTFSPVQSFILIHGNQRLKASWSQMWRGLRNQHR